MEELEKAYFSGIVVVGPCSPFDKYAEHTYDGSRLQFPSWWYNEGPWFIPIEVLGSNPDLYWKLVEQRKALKKKLNTVWGNALKLKGKVVGKAIFTTVGEHGENNEYRKLWNNSDPVQTKSGLYRFFTPAEKAIEEFKEARRNQDPREFERQYLQTPPPTDDTTTN